MYFTSENPFLSSLIVISDYIIASTKLDTGLGCTNFQINSLAFVFMFLNLLSLLDLTTLFLLLDMTQRSKALDILTVLGLLLRIVDGDEVRTLVIMKQHLTGTRRCI